MMILRGVFPLDESWDFDNASVNSMHHGYLEVLWMGQRNSAPVDGFCIPLFQASGGAGFWILPSTVHGVKATFKMGETVIFNLDLLRR